MASSIYGGRAYRRFRGMRTHGSKSRNPLSVLGIAGFFVSGGDVPRMPPLRYGLQLDYARDQFSANLRVTRAESQDHPGEFDTKTPGYVLLNLGLQYQVDANQDARLMVFAKGNNLLNENIRNSTSYMRNFAPEPGRGAEVGIRVSN